MTSNDLKYGDKRGVAGPALLCGLFQWWSKYISLSISRCIVLVSSRLKFKQTFQHVVSSLASLHACSLLVVVYWQGVGRQRGQLLKLESTEWNLQCMFYCFLFFLTAKAATAILMLMQEQQRMAAQSWFYSLVSQSRMLQSLLALVSPCRRRCCCCCTRIGSRSVLDLMED